ncbi:undecaprenyl-diphosphate phosphatase [Blattabacterium cuenoti]|uniref:undecaprenyl-diphosphate phosphatase n=1 Tax=Blattabacterium cuenoti TaxID=1653831 RepID=UPI00163D3A24|nr:undecaprenyl-diphosphate phosphatase [Blattabacterium cuenoti]
MNYLQSILLGIIEGITEFFPISSTGHMILIASMIGIIDDQITKLFLVSVQFGSILSILFLYRKKIFFQYWHFYIKILIAMCPVCILGFFLQHRTDFLIKNPIIIALSLFIGGIVILKCEHIYEKISHQNSQNITYYQSFIVGLFQCLAFIPGISRSAITIVSCMMQNISREKSIEFSFFLSVPVIGIATCKKLFDYYIDHQNALCSFHREVNILLLGNVFSFLTSIIAIKYFMKYLQQNNLKLFGYYRMIFGVFLIIIHYFIKPIKIF